MSDTISFEDFFKVDIRVGQILAVEAVPKSKKLLRLEVDFGELGKRTIMAGISQYYTPESLIGLKVAAVVNLAPRNMMGIESHGMLLAGHAGEESVFLVSCPDLPVGARLG